MDFSSIYGHEKIINRLKKSIKNNSVSHGYLFTGSNGLGKKKLALVFAKTLLCKSEQEDPCNTCSSCLKFDSNNHPDLHIEKPEKTSFKKEQIEEIRKDIKTKPYESRRKVFILEDVDKMTPHAQNSFLKTLEEPPDYAVIIMTSTNSHSILPTILSRSQVLRFSPIKTIEIENAIVESFNKSDETARFIAGFSNGIIGRAIEMCESDDFLNMRIDIINIIDDTISGDKFQVFSKTDFFEKNKNYIYDIIDIIYIWFRDILIIKECKNDNLIINKDKLDILKRQSKKISLNKVYEVLDIVNNTKDNISSKVNFQLSIEMMLLKIEEG